MFRVPSKSAVLDYCGFGLFNKALTKGVERPAKSAKKWALGKDPNCLELRIAGSMKKI